MKQYAVVMAITLILAWVVERTYVVAPGSLATKKKDRALVVLIYVVLTLFVGLRTHYNDTYTYRYFYKLTRPFPEFWETFSITIADHPGFELLSAWFRTEGVSEYTFILVCSAFSLLCTVWFLKKYSNNLLLTFFLFFATNTYMISAAAVKQSIAIGIGLLAIPFALEKKWIRFTVIVLAAAAFHPYVLFYLMIPFLTFKPWNKWSYIMLASFICAGFMLEPLLGTLVDITTMIGESYVEERFIGEGINLFRVLVSNVPTVLTFFYQKRLFRDSRPIDHVIINLTMLNGAIMFVGIFGTAIYFSRMASYFTIAQCIALPWVIGKLNRNERFVYTSGMVIGYALFFIYANMISQSFDYNFSRMTLMEYLSLS